MRTGTMLGATRPGLHPTHLARRHLDLAVRDLDDAEAVASLLGARKAGAQPRPDRWRVYLDPAGHPSA